VSSFKADLRANRLAKTQRELTKAINDAKKIPLSIQDAPQDSILDNSLVGLADNTLENAVRVSREPKSKKPNLHTIAHGAADSRRIAPDTVKNVALLLLFVALIAGGMTAYVMGDPRLTCSAPGEGPIGGQGDRWLYICTGPSPSIPPFLPAPNRRAGP
jgi:hypothetical protein